MKLSDILTARQLEICKKEHYYYKNIGIQKHILQIALEHNFIQKKDRSASYSLELLKEYEIIILSEDEHSFVVQTKELMGQNRLAELESKLRKKVIQQSIPVREFSEKFLEYLAVDPEVIEKRIKSFNAYDSEDSEVLDLFVMILRHAIRSGASDIHINAQSEFSWLRYRVDGRVVAKHLINSELHRRFALILKDRSNIDLIDVQTPKSGGFSETFDGKKIDFRIELAPSSYGENVVLRILDKSSNLKTLEELYPKTHPMGEHIKRFVNFDNGFFLVVGPTGSGKTTTLNAIVMQRDRLNEIIYTIEDPIEYKIDFAVQYQVNESIGFGFSEAIKSVMRQDPDVIVVGEMRDKESLQTALKAAHSGHMVYSTLHTTNSYMALERIRDEGGDLFVLAYSLCGVIAQRLVPRLCECKVDAQSKEGMEYFKAKNSGYIKKGCAKCNFSGYSSRVLLSDIVLIPSDMKIRYALYLALKNSTVLKVWDDLITFSYHDSARYLFEEGLCDYETLRSELLALGFIDEE